MYDPKYWYSVISSYKFQSYSTYGVVDNIQLNPYDDTREIRYNVKYLVEDHI